MNKKGLEFLVPGNQIGNTDGDMRLGDLERRLEKFGQLLGIHTD